MIGECFFFNSFRFYHFIRFKQRWNIRLTNSYKKYVPKDDEQSDDDANEMPLIISTVKEEDITMEPTFVNMDLLGDQICRPNESVATSDGNTGHSHNDIMDCMKQLIEWSEEHNIESLYLKMLHGLRNRIQIKSSSE